MNNNNDDIKLPDPHTLAPSPVRQLQKYYQKLPAEHIIKDDYVLDIQNPSSWHVSKLHQASKLNSQKLNDIWAEYGLDESQPLSLHDVNVFEHSSVPGFKIIPNLIPVQVQQVMLDRLLLRDLGIDKHQTNLHLHYHMPYNEQKGSLFYMDPDEVVKPKDEKMHKQLTVKNVQEKKLRWMTLGGQYDWTDRVYPEGQPVVFPKDLEKLIHGLVPSIRPEAAICNLYSPGDTLSPHRDVSEEADVSLVSMSIGCDALFLISVCEEDNRETDSQTPPPLDSVTGQLSGDKADSTTLSEPNHSHIPHKHRKKKVPVLPTPPPNYQNPKTLLLRIRSGDVVVMAGESRWAWHGVPKIFADGCPEELMNWPDIATHYNHGEGEKLSREGLEKWKGWMRSKRINLNVRQMYVNNNENVARNET